MKKYSINYGTPGIFTTFPEFETIEAESEDHAKELFKQIHADRIIYNVTEIK